MSFKEKIKKGYGHTKTGVKYAKVGLAAVLAPYVIYTCVQGARLVGTDEFKVRSEIAMYHVAQVYINHHIHQLSADKKTVFDGPRTKAQIQLKYESIKIDLGMRKLYKTKAQTQEKFDFELERTYNPLIYIR